MHLDLIADLHQGSLSLKDFTNHPDMIQLTDRHDFHAGFYKHAFARHEVIQYTRLRGCDGDGLAHLAGFLQSVDF